MDFSEHENYHAHSVESKNCWKGVRMCVREVRREKEPEIERECRHIEGREGCS